MNILDSVGNTPLLELKNIVRRFSGVKIFAKAEYFNPSGSVKDRAAKAMLLDGIKKGKLTKDKTIIDSTSGNTGIAYAMFGAALGYKVTLCIPANSSAERKKVLAAYGAKVIETDPLESSDGAYIKAMEIVKKSPEKYFFPNQYNNNANWQAHYKNTAPEILAQTKNKVTHFVCGAGTSGSFTGIAKRLKEQNASIKTILMQSDSPFHGIEGTKHLESTIMPDIFDESLVDAQVEVKTEQAYEMTRKLAKEEGLFVGISSGANVVAALKIAKSLPKNSVVVTLLCDNGYRYLSEPVWNSL